MRNKEKKLSYLPAVLIAICLVAASCNSARESAINAQAVRTQAAQTPTSSQTQSETRNQPYSQPDVESQRREAEQQAQLTIDQEAVVAIAETQNALRAIAANDGTETLAAIERATGKINILLARNPATALIPVAAEVEVLDAAPIDTEAIEERIRAVDKALVARDYPAMRVLLDGLTSEIHTRTYNLPLATYPAALMEAARLIDQQKSDDARAVLQAALNTLAIVDRARPIPIVLAQAAAIKAAELGKANKGQAQALLEFAKSELERAKLLGYLSNDPDYGALNQVITEIETQIKGDRDITSLFSGLRERIAAFFKRQSETERR
jgi:outer membrane protein OmpA-like peptidoglycan-associated protein